MNREELIRPGTIAVHFKRELLSAEEKLNSNAYIYKIITIAHNASTMEKEVVYKALYPNEKGEYITFVRPLEDFLSYVNKDKPRFNII